MKPFHLSDEIRLDVLRLVQSLGIRPSKAFRISTQLCARIAVSISAYLAEADNRVDPAELARELRLVTRLVLAVDPSIGLVRDHVAELSAYAVGQIEARALRLSSNAPAFSGIGLDLREWARRATPVDLLQVLRFCLVEGGAMVSGRRRPNGSQSAAHFEPVIFGRGRGVSLPKLKGGRPADDAEMRLIAHLAVDWLISTGVRPEGGRDGHSAFSGLVHDVFGSIGIEDKAIHSLRTYWAMAAGKAKATLRKDRQKYV
jgi:hypothetical protein